MTKYKLIMSKGGYVYILANGRNGTLYIGVTAKLAERIWQHKQKLLEEFTADYDVDKLVFAEFFPTIAEAVAQEKRIKEWKRRWKVELIESRNPEWLDLYDTL